MTDPTDLIAVVVASCSGCQGKWHPLMWAAFRSRAGEIGGLPIVSDPSVPDGMVKIVHGDGRVEMKPFP